MPRKGGRMTSQERKFAEVFAETGSTTYAAEKARYAFPEVQGARVLGRPAVQESVKRQQMARLNNELLPLALDTISTILKNEKATDSNKLTAAGLVMKYSVGQEGAGEAKEPHEMTADELAQRIQALRREAADRAKPVIEAETNDIDEDEPETGVFG